MRKYSLLTLLLLLSCCLSACSNAVQIQGNTLPEFERLFINKIPEEAYDGHYCSDLYVNKSNAVLGDPNYVVTFTLQFDNQSVFQNHLNNIYTTETAVLTNGNESILLYQWDEQHYIEYTNNETYDGFFFTFEIIAVNEETCEVRYLFAYVWDYWKDDHLLSELSQFYTMSSDFFSEGIRSPYLEQEDSSFA